MKKSLAIFVFVLPVFAACKSQTEKLSGHLDDESWHPVTIEVEDFDAFSCFIEKRSLIVEKKLPDLDELAIAKPGRSDWLAVIIDSPAIDLKVAISPKEFLGQERITFSLKELEGYSLAANLPEPELVFVERGQYQIIGTSSLESDEPIFVCRVDFDGKK